MDVRVVGLRRYPVKSMAGEALEECWLDTAGCVGDRAYAVVDRVTGKVASAKDPRRWSALLGMGATFVDPPEPGAALPPVTVTLADGTELRSDAPGTDAALSRVLGREVALSSDAQGHRTYEGVWPTVEGLAPQEFLDASETGRTDEGEAVLGLDLGALAPGTFLDVAPVHLLTRQTLEALGALAPGVDFDPRRFRPNVLVDVDGPGFSENGWTGQAIDLGGAEVSVALPTMRCVMTTLAQPGLAAQRRTLQTLAAHNRVEISGLGTWACAGAYAVVSRPGRVALSVPTSA